MIGIDFNVAPTKRIRHPSDLPDLPRELLQLIAIHLVFVSASSAPPPPPLQRGSRYGPRTVAPRRESEVFASSSSPSSRLDIPVEMPPTAPLTGMTGMDSGPLVQDLTLVPHPTALIPLMLTCRKINAALRFNGNERLYQKLYMATFDSEAVLRRYGKGRRQEPQQNGHGTSWKPITSTEKEQDGMIPSVQRMPSAAIHRSCIGAQMFHSSNKVESDVVRSLNLSTDPLPLANEYRERWNAIKQIRRCGEEQVLAVEGTFEFEDIVRYMWIVWWMVVEDDGQNKRLLIEYANIYNLISIHYHNVFVKQSLQPGYPSDSIDKMLVSNIAYQLRLGEDREAEAEEMDTLLFVNRPFVFACHKYRTHIAPWINRVLPLSGCATDLTELRLLRERNLSIDDLTPLKQETERFGKLWNVVMLSTSDVSSLRFMSVLDRHPELLALVKNPDAPMMSSAGTFIPPTSPLGMLTSSAISIGGTSSCFPRRASGPSSTPTSQMYDPDFVRSLSCISIVDSPGLPPMFYRHRFEGLWQGKYVYFDFPAYQSSLGGNIRSIYEGDFGEQEQEMFLQEIVINVRLDQVGGKGSPLLAGFQPCELIDEAWKKQPGTAEERGWEIRHDENAPDRPGWTKELMIIGRGKSAWGEFSVNGRVRSWDGLMTIVVNYADCHPTGKWHFRGYVHAGDVISGRWRETFTKENMKGYEGSWVAYKVDGPAFHERQQEKAMLSRSAPLTNRPVHNPYQQGPAILLVLDIPVYRPAQPARTMAGVPPIRHEYMERRIRDPSGYVRAWGRSLPRAPLPRALCLPVPAEYTQSLTQSSPQSNVLPPIIDPAHVEDKRVLSPGGMYHHHSAVPDMWCRSLASGVKRKLEERGNMKTSENEESMRSVRRPWEDEERLNRYDLP